MMEEIVNVVNNVGFPIACVLGLFWYMTRQEKSFEEERKASNEAIANNTLVMHQILEVLRKEVK